MIVLNISDMTLGKSSRLGFVNQQIELYSHVVCAIKNKINFINIDSVNWILSWNNKNNIKHSEIFDIEFWNYLAPNYNFPIFINTNNDNTIIKKTFNCCWQKSAIDFLDINNEYSIVFSKLLKPKRYILDIINAIKPKSYGTIHFRLERDLKIVPNWYEKYKINIEKIYDQIENIIIETPNVVYACVCRADVINDYAIEIFNNNISPWKNIPLIFGGGDICKQYNIKEELHSIIGAIIDYYIAIDSTHFFIGPFDLSTFSHSISSIRIRNKLKTYKISKDINNKITAL